MGGLPRKVARSRSPDADSRRVRRLWGRFLDANSPWLEESFAEGRSAFREGRDEAGRLDYARWRVRSMRYCRQAFRWQPDGPAFCNVAYACPFCWARAAGEVWDRVDAFLFPGGEPREEPYDLVATSRTFAPERALGPVLRQRLGHDPLDRFGDHPDRMIGRRADEMDRLNHAAGYETLTAWPTAVREGEAWEPRIEIAVRQLFAIPPGAVLGEIPPCPVASRSRTTRWQAPSRVEAARRVAALCRYPAAYLVRPAGLPPEAQVAGLSCIMAFRRGARLWGGYGGFRAGAKPRKVRMASPPAAGREADYPF